VVKYDFGDPIQKDTDGANGVIAKQIIGAVLFEEYGTATSMPPCQRRIWCVKNRLIVLTFVVTKIRTQIKE